MNGSPRPDSGGSAPARIVRIIARLNVGGPARHTVILDAGLRAMGYRTLLVHGAVAAGETSMEDLAEARGIPTRRIPSLGRRIGLADDVRAFREILRVLRDVQPDIVHTHTAKAGALGRVAAAFHNLARRRSRTCVVIHTFHGHVLQGYFGRLQTALVRFIERRLSTITDYTVTISDEQRRDIVDRYAIAPAERVVVVPLGLELADLLRRADEYSTLRHELGWDAGDFVVGYVGRLVPIKDLPTLIEGVRLASSKVPGIRLLVAGDGELRLDIERLVQRLQLADRVRLLGWRRDLVSVYGAMDAFALTSRNEGTPVSLIEAMAAAVPVIATRVGGVPDVVEHGRTGTLIPAAQPAALADALVQLATGRDRARTMVAAARADVAARFASERLVRDIAGLYSSALARKRRTRVAGPLPFAAQL